MLKKAKKAVMKKYYDALVGLTVKAENTYSRIDNFIYDTKEHISDGIYKLKDLKDRAVGKIFPSDEEKEHRRQLKEMAYIDKEIDKSIAAYNEHRKKLDEEEKRLGLDKDDREHTLDGDWKYTEEDYERDLKLADEMLLKPHDQYIEEDGYKLYFDKDTIKEKSEDAKKEAAEKLQYTRDLEEYRRERELKKQHDKEYEEHLKEEAEEEARLKQAQNKLKSRWRRAKEKVGNAWDTTKYVLKSPFSSAAHATTTLRDKIDDVKENLLFKLIKDPEDDKEDDEVIEVSTGEKNTKH